MGFEEVKAGKKTITEVSKALKNSKASRNSKGTTEPKPKSAFEDDVWKAWQKLLLKFPAEKTGHVLRLVHNFINESGWDLKD